MLSRENTIIAVCVVLAVIAAVGIDTVADVPDWFPVALLIGLGGIVPLLVNTALDSRETA
jgi:hypothetical protein